MQSMKKHLSQQLPKASHQWSCVLYKNINGMHGHKSYVFVVCRDGEEVSERSDAVQCLTKLQIKVSRWITKCNLNDNVDVIGIFDVVQPHSSRNVLAVFFNCWLSATEPSSPAVKTTTKLHFGIEGQNQLARVRGIQDIFDVVQGRVENLVVVRYTVDSLSGQLDEHVVRVFQRMEVSGRAACASLKEFATHQASIDVQVRVRHGTDFLEVEIQCVTINGVQIGTESLLLHFSSLMRIRRVLVKFVIILLVLFDGLSGSLRHRLHSRRSCSDWFLFNDGFGRSFWNSLFIFAFFLRL